MFNFCDNWNNRKLITMRKYLCFVLALAFIFGSCHNFMGKRIRGDGNIRSEDRSVGSFKNVDVSGVAKVYVSQGDQHSVKVEADENLLPYIEVAQEGDRIIVRERPGFNLKPTGDINVYVTSPIYNKIEASGACDIIGQNKIVNQEDLELHVSGAGDIKMEVDAPQLSAEVSGSGNINLKGQTKNVDLQLTGAGHAHCYDLMAENTKVDITGAGSAEVYASVKLEAEVSGAGTVKYKGNATNVTQDVSGAGSVQKAD
jgi:Putative auto-transporter adhesin, head GIN domain